MEHVAARGRVGEAHGRVARAQRAGLACVFQCELVGQRTVRIDPAVGQERCGGLGRHGRHRAQAGVAPQLLGERALGRGAFGRRDLLAARLEELALGVVRERNIQPVYPGHGRGGGVVVSMPVPAGLRQEVATRHPNRVAVDYRPHPLAFDHEAESMLRVAVFRRIFARH